MNRLTCFTAGDEAAWSRETHFERLTVPLCDAVAVVNRYMVFNSTVRLPTRVPTEKRAIFDKRRRSNSFSPVLFRLGGVTLPVVAGFPRLFVSSACCTFRMRMLARMRLLPRPQKSMLCPLLLPTSFVSFAMRVPAVSGYVTVIIKLSGVSRVIAVDPRRPLRVK